MVRKGFTLLELIVSITVLGLAFSAIPMLLVSDNKAQETSITQEAIYAASTKMAQLLTYKWDELSSTENAGFGLTMSKVLDVPASASTNAVFARVPNTSMRVGHFNLTGRRALFNTPTTLSTLGFDANDATVADDIDDITQTQTLIAIDNSAQGYKATYDINVSVDFVSDIATYTNTAITAFHFGATSNGNPTHLKRISISVSDAVSNAVLFTLESFSANIGETAIASRIF